MNENGIDTNIIEFRADLKAMEEKILKAGSRAVYDEVQVIKKLSKADAPRDTGALSRSGYSGFKRYFGETAGAVGRVGFSEVYGRFVPHGEGGSFLSENVDEDRFVKRVRDAIEKEAAKSE